jgi:hypothetical protein
MSKLKPECPTCKVELAPLLLSDVIGEHIHSDSETWVVVFRQMFRYFQFLLCTRCGYTRMYANRETRMRAGK